MSFQLDYRALRVQSMRDAVTQLGFIELRTVREVEEALAKVEGTTLVFVNSVCGCAGGIARPAAELALQTGSRPERLLTVFAGQDKEATERARQFFVGYPPSSPSMFLFKDGELVGALQRSDIEGYDVETVAKHLQELLQRHCAA